MKYLLPLCLLLLLQGCLSKKEFSQITEDERIEAIDFPSDWVGNWKGDLKIYSGLGLQDQLKMELLIQPIEKNKTFSFTIVYDTGVELTKRNYELIVVDKDQGLFLVDEKNTILIESYFIGGKWFQRFEVAETMLSCTIEQMGEHLIWEIGSGSAKEISTSGDTKLEGILEVKTYPVGVYQRAVLTRY